MKSSMLIHLSLTLVNKFLGGLSCSTWIFRNILKILAVNLASSSSSQIGSLIHFKATGYPMCLIIIFHRSICSFDETLVKVRQSFEKAVQISLSLGSDLII